MSKSTHQIAIKAVDKTAGAFSSIQSRAAAASARMRGMLGSALAGVGAFMGARAIKGTVDELGRLSDISMKTGASVADLTSSVTAFQTMGLDISVDSLAKSFQYLNKSTGKSGMAGFKEALQNIAKIEDPLKRGNELTRTFGRAGLELLPLIDGGEKAVNAFTDLASLMPRIGDGAANAGDEIADAMNIMTTGAKSMWSNAIGYICGLWAKDFPGGVRAGALNAYNSLETFFRKVGAWIAKVGTNVISLGALMKDAFSIGPGEAWEIYKKTNQAAESDFKASIEKINADRDAYVAKLKQFDVTALSNALGGKRNGGDTESQALGSLKTIRNDLIMAGSAASLKLQMVGPQLQSETKKQTALLEDIAETNRKALEAQNKEDSLHLEVL